MGAGFASGREIISFFTQYGPAGVWLILLAGALMTLLCMMCMKASAACGAECWCDLYGGGEGWQYHTARGSILLLMTLTGGAMISAAGHMISLLWYHPWSYAAGAVGTAALAWRMTYRSIRPVSWLSTVLTAVFLTAVCLALAKAPSARNVAVPSAGKTGMFTAVIRTVGYASMNITLAIGVACRRTGASSGRTSILFGALMTILLLVSHTLYLRHPALTGEAFPIVRLLSTFGRSGFLLSAALLYLSVFTSLTAILFALRCGFQPWTGTFWSGILTMGIPLAASCLGFLEIVDSLYAPAGLVCLALVFGPMAKQIHLDKKG